ncbi:MAG: alpha/beta hydrolase [Candidatus Eremiobacteraeota bacterium]|nr:alpha/beta hydrolase [Candidatus Eremiobacteraeota bacterium]
MIETIWTPAADGVLSGARHDGERGDAIVFVHGVGSSAAIWDYQLHAFAKDYRCYAIELRGNGSAQHDPDPQRIDREGFVQDVLAIAKTAQLDRFHFVGCSLGGVVGFELWKRIPERLLSLTFVGSFAAYPNATSQVETILAGATQAGSVAAFGRARVGKLLPSDASPVRHQETIDQMARKSLPSYIASTKATWTGDYRDVLSTISVPTLVLCGELDLIAPLALSEEIAHAIPHAQLRVIPGAGHITNADQPAAFNAALREFLTTCSVH